MGCVPTSDPLLADIYRQYEEKYDFEHIFPSDPSQTKDASKIFSTFNNMTPNTSPLLQSQINERMDIITDADIDINKNSSNLSESSPPYDILIDLNDKLSKLNIRLARYNGAELQPLIKLGLNESKHSPQRQSLDANNLDDNLLNAPNDALSSMEAIVSYFIRECSLNVQQLCAQKFFPSDLKCMIISFYSRADPKLLSFRVLISTAILCRSTLNICQYIGAMFAHKLLFQKFIKTNNISNINDINQELLICDENASVCRQLIFLFHYILCLDQYKMPKQQPLTNNFTAYKRMHADFANRRNYAGGGFASFAEENNSEQQMDYNFSENELLPIEEITNIAMFMGKGSSACLDTICDDFKSENRVFDEQILCEFGNGCLTLLRSNGNNKQNRNTKIVKYALYILRAMVAILLILDNKKSGINQFNSVFGNNENKVKNVECCRMITTQFMQLFGDENSCKIMQGITAKQDIVYHIKYCKRIIKFGAKGFKNGCVKRSIQNMF